MKLHTSPILVHNVEISLTYNLDEVQILISVKPAYIIIIIIIIITKQYESFHTHKFQYFQ